MKMRTVIVMTAAVLALAVSACGRDESTLAPNPTPSATVTETVSPRPDATGAEDVSGNCDEVEHANDATCQAGESADDSSGSGSGAGSGGGDGSGSGPGY
jgi:hypothetical protein